ncbi:MAG: ABC-three component system protein [Planctomycetota bacterium]
MTNGASANGHPFSAASSAMGYLFQCRYALLEALRRMRHNVDFQVCIETLDDVVFEQQGEAPELLQTKHHINRAADLTDASVDMWKTLRIWCEGVANGSLLIGSRFVLVTTASAGSDSAAALLKPGTRRDVSGALDRLRSTASASTSHTNAPAYTAFRALDIPTQRALFEGIWVVDAVSTITSLDADMRQEVFYAVDHNFLNAFLTRLEGWWFRRVIRHLATERGVPILSAELLDEINNLRDSLREDNLPIDDAIEQMKVDATGYHDRVFVHQLRLIQISNERIVRAIRDYYRAFVQRSRWVREELIGVGDLERYENRLKDAWEGRFLAMRDEMGQVAAEEEQRRLAGQLYKWVETEDLPRIRTRCADGFVARGSYQILADHLKVGWHPEFETRLRHLLEPTTQEAGQ